MVPNVTEGSLAANRFADRAAGLRSFELNCQAAAIQENPVSASSSHWRTAAPELFVNI